MKNPEARLLIKEMIQEIVAEGGYNLTDPLKKPFFNLDPKWQNATPEEIKKAITLARKELSLRKRNVATTTNPLQAKDNNSRINLLWMQISELRKLLTAKLPPKGKRRPKPLMKRFKSWVKKLIKETADPRAQFAMGYRRAQSNYHNEQLLRDFTGYSEPFVKGYKSGVKDARIGKFNDAVLKILTKLGDVLGAKNIGGRSGPF